MTGSHGELDAGCSLFVVLGAECWSEGKVDEGGAGTPPPVAKCDVL